MNLYLFNPEANRGKAKKLKKKIICYLESLGIMGEFVELKKIGEATEITKEAIKDGMGTVVAVGGDGIVNEIIQEIAETDAQLGIIPIGETNLLASILGIDNWKIGCETLAKGMTTEIDLGIVSDRYFTSSVEVENELEQEKILGVIPFRKAKKYYPVSIAISSDSTKLKMQTNISSIMVSTIPIPLPADLDVFDALTDNKIHILIKSKPLANPRKKKQRKSGDELSQLEGNVISIKSKSSILVKADGEACGETPIDIGIAPKGLKVIVPKKEESENS